MVKPQLSFSSSTVRFIVEVLILWSSRNYTSIQEHPNLIVEVLILWSSRNFVANDITNAEL